MTIAKLTREVTEREAVNTDNYHTIQALRRRVQDLDKHKFVLGYKVGGMAMVTTLRTAVRACMHVAAHPSKRKAIHGTGMMCFHARLPLA